MITRVMVRNDILAAILVALVANAGLAQTPGREVAEPISGAKLAHRLPYEVQHYPKLLDTTVGPRLLYSRPADEKPKFDEAARGNIVFWDIPDGIELHRILPTENVSYGGYYTEPWPFTPDGKKFAYVEISNFTRQICVYDIATRKVERLPGKYAQLHAYLMSPDGALVVVHSDAKGCFCTAQEIGKAKPRQSFKLTVPKTSTFGPIRVAAELSADGSNLAVSIDGTLIVYEMKSGKAVYQASKGSAGAVFAPSLVFSPLKNEQILLAVEHVAAKPKDLVLAHVLDVKAKKEIARRTIFERPTKGANLDMPLFRPWKFEAYPFFSSKGEPCVVLDGKIHDVAAGKVLAQFDPKAGVRISRDGKYLVRLTPGAGSQYFTGVEIWNLEGAK